MASEFLLLMVVLEKTWFTPVGKVLDERDGMIRSGGEPSAGPATHARGGGPCPCSREFGHFKGKKGKGSLDYDGDPESDRCSCYILRDKLGSVKDNTGDVEKFADWECLLDGWSLAHHRGQEGMYVLDSVLGPSGH